MASRLEIHPDRAYALGHEHGYHVGRCRAMLLQTEAFQGRKVDIRVLYVTAGMTGPFPALDRAVVEALRGLVREVYVVGPRQNVAQMAKLHKPDLVLVLHGIRLPAHEAGTIRAMGIQTAVWFVDDPYITDWSVKIAPRFDWVFTHELSCVSFYRNIGCRNVHYLPLAASPGIYTPKYVDPAYQSDVCFVGNAFWNRAKLFDSLVPALRGLNVRLVGRFWRRLRHYSRYSAGIRHTWVSPEQAASYYNGAKIVINIHRSHRDKQHNRNSRGIPGLSINPRTYEIAACGAFQLTDIRQDLTSFYTPGFEIATYTSPHELAERIRYYLDHIEESREIALVGLRRTLREHTFKHRLSDLLGMIFG